MMNTVHGLWSRSVAVGCSCTGLRRLPETLLVNTCISLLVLLCHPSPATTEALSRIGELYAIEADIRGRPAEERRQARETRSRPILIGLERWIREKLTTLSRQADTAKNYLMNHWPARYYYAGDGWAEIGNNIAENALRG